MTADLHIHTTFSDGIYTPREIVQKAKAADLKTIAITDHDAADGILPAREAGEQLGVEVLPGIEFSAEIPENEIHILGYFIDWQQDWFLELLKRIQDSRQNRIRQILKKLEKMQIPLDLKRVLEFAGAGSAGRPHVAKALLEGGWVKTGKEAFDKYLRFGGPAYVKHYKLNPKEAIEIIKKLKGIAVLAHPGVSKCDDLIPELKSYGLAGIEAYYLGHTDSQTENYLNLAQKLGLIVTGGSDFHGSETDLGAITLPDSLVDQMREKNHEI